MLDNIENSIEKESENNLDVVQDLIEIALGEIRRKYKMEEEILDNIEDSIKEELENNLDNIQDIINTTQSIFIFDRGYTTMELFVHIIEMNSFL